MISLLRIVAKLPIPTEWRLSWQRTLLDRAFEKDISAAIKLKDGIKVERLKHDHRFEIDFHDEEEDAYLTKKLLSKARKLRVPVPHRYNEDKIESEHWYQGHYTGRWCLTRSGYSTLMNSIRLEEEARHNSLSRRVAWVPLLLSFIGSILGSGLITSLLHWQCK